MPIEADTGAGYGADPVSSGPYAITSVDPATGILLDRNPQWDPTTDGVRTALPDQVIVRTGLSGVERDQALLAGSADLDITGTGVQAATTSRLAEDEDDAVRGRVDDVTTGALRMLALPTDVAPMDNADCRAAVAAVVDRKALQTTLGGPVNVVRALAAVAARAPRRARGPRPAARPRRGACAPGGLRAAGRLLDGAGRRRHAERCRPGRRGRR